jgi:hypothetical protein
MTLTAHLRTIRVEALTATPRHTGWHLVGHWMPQQLPQALAQVERLTAHGRWVRLIVECQPGREGRP